MQTVSESCYNQFSIFQFPYCIVLQFTALHCLYCKIILVQSVNRDSISYIWLIQTLKPLIYWKTITTLPRCRNICQNAKNNSSSRNKFHEWNEAEKLPTIKMSVTRAQFRETNVSPMNIRTWNNQINRRTLKAKQQNLMKLKEKSHAFEHLLQAVGHCNWYCATCNFVSCV